MKLPGLSLILAVLLTAAGCTDTGSLSGWFTPTADSTGDDVYGFKYHHLFNTDRPPRGLIEVDTNHIWRFTGNDHDSLFIEYSSDNYKNWQLEKDLTLLPGEFFRKDFLMTSAHTVFFATNRRIFYSKEFHHWQVLSLDTIIKEKISYISCFSNPAQDLFYVLVNGKKIIRVDSDGKMLLLNALPVTAGGTIGITFSNDTIFCLGIRIIEDRPHARQFLTLYRSFDQGIGWQEVNIPDENKIDLSDGFVQFMDIWIENGSLFLGYSSFAYSSLRKSPDLGMTWLKPVTFSNNITPSMQFGKTADFLWLYSGKNIYCSMNGISWCELATPIPSGEQHYLPVGILFSGTKCFLPCSLVDASYSIFSLDNQPLDDFKKITKYRIKDYEDSIVVDLQFNKVKYNTGDSRLMIKAADTFSFKGGASRVLLVDTIITGSHLNAFHFSFSPRKINTTRLTPYELQLTLTDNSLTRTYTLGPLDYNPTNIFQQYPKLFLTLAIILGYFTILLLLLLLKPIWLYTLSSNLNILSRLEEGLGKYGNTIKVLRDLTFTPLFVHSSRTLDAWVDKYAPAFRSAFERQPTVKGRSAYIPLPLKSGSGQGELIEKITPEILGTLFSSDTVTLEIVGAGGTGKTTLAVQIARWISDKDNRQYFGGHIWLPVLVEEDASRIMEVLTEKIKAWTGQQLNKSFLRALLRKKRILVIFDALSERTDEIQKYVASIHGKEPLNALLITSRKEIGMEIGAEKGIYPIALTPDKLLYFISTTLELYKIQAFDNVKNQLLLAQRFAEVFTVNGKELPVIPILIKLLMEKLIDEIKAIPPPIDIQAILNTLPNSIPEIFFDYLNRVNPKGTVPNGMTDADMRKSAELIARESLGDNFIPQDIPMQVIADLLKKEGLYTDSCNPVERLKDNGVLEERPPRGGEKILRFTLDPLAEYLAAFHYARELGKDCDRWKSFYEKIRSEENAKGFYVALRLIQTIYSQFYKWCPTNEENSFV